MSLTNNILEVFWYLQKMIVQSLEQPIVVTPVLFGGCVTQLSPNPCAGNAKHLKVLQVDNLCFLCHCITPFDRGFRSLQGSLQAANSVVDGFDRRFQAKWIGG